MCEMETMKHVVPIVMPGRQRRQQIHIVAHHIDLSFRLLFYVHRLINEK